MDLQFPEVCRTNPATEFLLQELNKVRRELRELQETMRELQHQRTDFLIGEVHAQGSD